MLPLTDTHHKQQQQLCKCIVYNFVMIGLVYNIPRRLPALIFITAKAKALTREGASALVCSSCANHAAHANGRSGRWS